MDFHFYQSSSQGSGQKSNLRKTLFAFLPLFILAGILPITLGLVKTPITDRFSSEAALNDLTIWFEPANIIASSGKPVTLTVYAHFESDKLLPGIKFPIVVEGPASIENPQINSITPFNGQVSLGTIKIFPFKPGKVIVSVDPKSVISETFNSTFNAQSSKATIIVN